MLDGQRSMAARHRMLQEERLTYQSIDSFRKRWVSGASWIRTYIRPDSLRQAYRLVNAREGSLPALLEDLEAVERRAGGQAAPVGEPVYVLSR